MNTEYQLGLFAKRVAKRGHIIFNLQLYHYFQVIAVKIMTFEICLE